MEEPNVQPNKEEPKKQTLSEKIEDAKFGMKIQFQALIENAKDPMGIKALMDRIMDDMKLIGKITDDERSGRPIDIIEARRVVGEVDDFVVAAKKIPGLGTATRLMGLSRIQAGAHKHLHELEEKAKTQGVVEHATEETNNKKE